MSLELASTVIAYTYLQPSYYDPLLVPVPNKPIDRCAVEKVDDVWYGLFRVLPGNQDWGTNANLKPTLTNRCKVRQGFVNSFDPNERRGSSDDAVIGLWENSASAVQRVSEAAP